MYYTWTEKGRVATKSLKLRVGDIVEVHINQRVPADMILLATHDKAGIAVWYIFRYRYGVHPNRLVGRRDGLEVKVDTQAAQLGASK